MNARGYGLDETSDFETLSEAERNPDGTVEMRVVLVDKRATDRELVGPDD